MAGLEDAVALGVTTNQAFLQRCLAHPVFAAGGATTAFIAQHQDELLAADAAAQDARRRARGRAAATRPPAIAVARQGRRMTHTLPISLRFDARRADARRRRRARASRDRRFSVRIGEQVFEIDRVELGDALACASSATAWPNARPSIATARSLLLHYRGRPLRVEDTTRAAALQAGDAAGDGKLRASMNGRVVAVHGGRRRHGRGRPADRHAGGHEDGARPRGAVVGPASTALHVKTGDQVAASRVVAEIAIEVRDA